MKPEKSRLRYVVQLTRYIRGFGAYLFFAILSNLVYKILPLVTSVVTAYMVGGIVAGDLERLPVFMAVVGALVLLIAAFSYLDVQVSHDMAYRILAQLRDRCYAKLDELSPAVMVGKRSGDMLSIVMGDVETLEWFYAHTIGQLVVAVLIPAAALAFMGTLSWVLPAVIVPFILLLLWIPKSSAKKSDAQGARVKAATGVLHAVIIDGVQGLKDIISFRWQREYLERFARANSNYVKANMDYAMRRADDNRKTTLIVEAAALATDVAAVTLAVSGQLSAVWLMPVFVMASAIYNPIMEALSMSANYGLIFGAARRVMGLLGERAAVEDTGKKRLQLRGQPVEVAFRDVRFTYPAAAGESKNAPVLNGLSFSFCTGETVALVGASGCGKSTAARLLQRFWDVDAGGVFINGTDVRELSLEALRDLVTVVPQEVYLFNKSVEENLRMAKLTATRDEIVRAARQAQVDAFIEKLPAGYETEIGERGLRLSGGEKQRLSIAQAFLKNAPILVLDEASANLDAENERLINRAVGALKQGRATLVIAHRVSTIRSANRIVIIKDGRVLAEGIYDALMADCDYFRTLIGEAYEGDGEHADGQAE